MRPVDMYGNPVPDHERPIDPTLKNGYKDWVNKCLNCDQLPTVHPLGLCGPCTFGEADTAGGNW